MVRTFTLIGSALLVVACAGITDDPNTLRVNFICNPAGAALYQDNINVGTCPTTLRYQILDQDRAQGQKTLKGITAHWVSGVSSSVSSISANLENGLLQHFRFERPRNIPNYDVDANYAINLEKNQIARAQVEALRAQADALQNQNVTVTVDNQSAPIQAPSRRTNCTSTRGVGGTVYTNCY